MEMPLRGRNNFLRGAILSLLRAEATHDTPLRMHHSPRALERATSISKYCDFHSSFQCRCCPPQETSVPDTPFAHSHLQNVCHGFPRVTWKQAVPASELPLEQLLTSLFSSCWLRREGIRLLWGFARTACAFSPQKNPQQQSYPCVT